MSKAIPRTIGFLVLDNDLVKMWPGKWDSSRVGRSCACLEPNTYGKRAKIYQKRPNYNFSNAA